MPKQIVVTAISNTIEYATTNGKGLITGKREDITDDAIRAVFQHLMNEFNKRKVDEPDREDFGYTFGNHGTIYYVPNND